MKVIHVLLIVALCYGCRPGSETVQTATTDSLYMEQHRPQLHFSPNEQWMNDPNGMVYYKGEYHLFYQYYPDSTVWGPMHWGHAITKDLVHWEHLPIALYPDSLGLIFSGSAVVDERNSSGLGTAENPPMVAIFTYHSEEKARKGRTDYQTQGMAYSLDSGRTWKKYEKNPVIRNPGIADFRDPKVFWHEGSKKWVMILAVQDHIELYGSRDLKSWSKLSEFGKDYGAHGGVWECPDLFELQADGEQTKKWILLLSINPGGPSGGSATQYFVGHFDGEKFVCEDDRASVKWLDYGPDNYAGVTWSNVPGNRRILLGWMNNWAYAQVVPTKKWRGAMTTPRDLRLSKTGDDYFVKSSLSEEFRSHGARSSQTGKPDTSDIRTAALSIVEGSVDAKDFQIRFSNTRNQHVTLGYELKSNRFFIDRSGSGDTTFSETFTRVSYAGRIARDNQIDFVIVTDVSSIEVFYDDGLTVMTCTFFPDEPMTKMMISSEGKPVDASAVTVSPLAPVW